MRTATTKQLEVLSFEKLSSWSIIAGAGKELYKRYDTEIWATGFWLELALIVWMKLG